MVNTHTLLDAFTPFDIKYAGLVPEITSDIDPSGRTDLLKVLDQGMKDGHISRADPKRLELDAVLSINAYSIRITDKKTQELLLCAPVHLIASVGFVKEDGFNILPIKIGEIDGNRDVYDLAVIYCKTSDIAEMICNILGQCFQLVYREAVSCIDSTVPTTTINSNNSNNNQHISNNHQNVTDIFGSNSRSASITSHNNEPAFISGSRTDLRVSSRPQRHNLQSSATPSESDHAGELIQEFINMLSVCLSNEEMSQFAQLMMKYRSEHMPITEFAQKLLELYGTDRKHLLARMRPFVHGADDVHSFNRFLEIAGITDNAASSLASNSPASDSVYSRSVADSSGGEWNSLRTMLTTPFGSWQHEAPPPSDDDQRMPPPRRNRRPPLHESSIIEMTEMSAAAVSSSIDNNINNLTLYGHDNERKL